jgi:hypothetical protein
MNVHILFPSSRTGPKYMRLSSLSDLKPSIIMFGDIFLLV